MSVLYLALAFLGGWICCWKTVSLLARKGWRNPTAIKKALGRISYDEVVSLREKVDAEIQRRRSAP